MLFVLTLFQMCCALSLPGTSPAFPRLLPSAPFAVESFSLTPGAGMMASGATSTAPAAGGATAAAGSGPEAAVGVAVEGGVPMMFGPGMGLMPGRAKLCICQLDILEATCAIAVVLGLCTVLAFSLRSKPRVQHTQLCRYVMCCV